MASFKISFKFVDLFCSKPYLTASVADSLSHSGTLPLTAFLSVKACQNQRNANTYSVFPYDADIFSTHYPNAKVSCAEARDAGDRSLNGDRKGQGFDIHTVISKEFKGQNQRHDPAVVQRSRNTKQL